MATEFNMSYAPKSGVRVPFQKIFIDTTDPTAASNFANQISALQKSGAGLSLTRKLQVNGSAADASGPGYRCILKCLAADHTIVRINIEHWDVTKSPNDAYAAISSLVTSSGGSALTALVEAILQEVVYV